MKSMKILPLTVASLFALTMGAAGCTRTNNSDARYSSPSSRATDEAYSNGASGITEGGSGGAASSDEQPGSSTGGGGTQDSGSGTAQ